MYNETDLAGKKLPELKEIGIGLSIPKAKYMRKPELIESILAHNGDGEIANVTNFRTTVSNLSRGINMVVRIC